MRPAVWVALASLALGPVPGFSDPPPDGRWTVGIVAHADSQGEILPCT